MDKRADGCVFTVRDREFKIRLWDGSMPPLIADSLAVDSETKKIDDRQSWLIPPVVIAQVCDGYNVDIIPWELIPRYFSELDKLKSDIMYYMFNAGFDIPVTGYLPSLTKALAERRLIDISPRYVLQQIKDTGDNPKRVSLDIVCRNVLLHQMNKDEAIRLSFDRNAEVTFDQLLYAAADPAVTIMLAEAIEPQWTEDLQTQAAFTLSEMQRRGIFVDMPRLARVRKYYNDKKAKSEDTLFELEYDVYSNLSNKKLMERLFADIGMTGDTSKAFTVNQARMLCFKMLERLDDDMPLLSLYFEEIFNRLAEGDKELKKEINKNSEKRKSINALFETLMFTGLAETTTARPFIMIVKRLFKYKADGYSKDTILELTARDFSVYHGWQGDEMVGKQQFLQAHFEKIEADNDMEFERTEKSGMIKFGKTEKWKLEERNIKDTLMTEFLDYQHTNKILSTYLNPKMIHSDNKYHPWFNVLVRTGRTSCSGPNVFLTNHL